MAPKIGNAYTLVRDMSPCDKLLAAEQLSSAAVSPDSFAVVSTSGLGTTNNAHVFETWPQSRGSM